MSKRSMDRKFAGSAVLLQEKMRQDPEAYAEEYAQHLAHFESLVDVLKTNVTAVPEKSTTDLIQTVTCVCSKVHGDAASRLCTHITTLLSPPVVATLPSSISRSLLQGLMLLRSRDLVPSSKTLPLFLQLLAMKDKETRKMLLWHISSDIYKTNQKTKNHGENRRLQAQMNDIVQEDDGNRSRHMLSLMIDLYRRRVWNDDLTVHFISQAVFLRNTRTVKIALKFLLSRTYTLGVDSDDEEDKKDPGKKIMVLKRQLRVRKKTRGRKRKVNSKVKSLSKGYKGEGGGGGSDDDVGGTGRKESTLQPEHDPILLIRDPQEYAEKLFKQLQRTSEKFDVRLLCMNVLSRLISTHHLLVLPFYSYLERYMEPYQREVSSILAVVVQSVHSLVPPDTLFPLVKTIANHFVSDKATPDAITIGLNTIREICKRQPLVMEPTLLQDLIQYKTYREDKGVVMAARSLLRFFRIVQPDMLPARERGRGHDPTRKIASYGSSNADVTIPGFDLLVDHELQGTEDGMSGAGEKSLQSDEDDDDEDGDEVDDEESGDDDDDDDDGIEGSGLEESDEDDDEEEAAEVDEDGDDDVESGEEEDAGGAVVDEDDDDEDEWSDEENDDDDDDDEAPELVPVAPLSYKGTDNGSGTIRTTGSISTLADRLLTPEDFLLMSKLRKKQEQDKAGKKKMAAGKRAREAMEAEVAELVDPASLELHSSKKRHRDKEEKLKVVQEERNKHSIGYKKQHKKGNSTNAEKRKTKLFQMSQRSRRVGARIRSSRSKQNERKEESKQRSVKFRIKRGYGA